MKTKREIKIVLLTFAITSIMWCILFGHVLGEISNKNCL